MSVQFPRTNTVCYKFGFYLTDALSLIYAPCVYDIGASPSDNILTYSLATLSLIFTRSFKNCLCIAK